MYNRDKIVGALSTNNILLIFHLDDDARVHMYVKKGLPHFKSKCTDQCYFSIFFQYSEIVRILIFSVFISISVRSLINLVVFVILLVFISV